MTKLRIKVLVLFVTVGLIAPGSFIFAEKKKRAMPEEFYIYKDRGSRLNHYIPSGWMGDFGDIKFNQGYTKEYWLPKLEKNKKSKKKKGVNSSIQIRYSAERKQGAGWAGIYWQSPANNWGDKRGGYNLSEYSKLVFWAKGKEGGEVVDKFFIGGITGQTEEGDSDEASISPVELTNQWEMYEIDLTGLDMSHIIGGFGFACNGNANPDGFEIYVDEVKLIRL